MDRFTTIVLIAWLLGCSVSNLAWAQQKDTLPIFGLPSNLSIFKQAQPVNIPDTVFASKPDTALADSVLTTTDSIAPTDSLADLTNDSIPTDAIVAYDPWQHKDSLLYQYYIQINTFLDFLEVYKERKEFFTNADATLYTYNASLGAESDRIELIYNIHDPQTTTPRLDLIINRYKGQTLKQQKKVTNIVRHPFASKAMLFSEEVEAIIMDEEGQVLFQQTYNLIFKYYLSQFIGNEGKYISEKDQHNKWFVVDYSEKYGGSGLGIAQHGITNKGQEYTIGDKYYYYNIKTFVLAFNPMDVTVVLPPERLKLKEQVMHAGSQALFSRNIQQKKYAPVPGFSEY